MKRYNIASLLPAPIQLGLYPNILWVSIFFLLGTLQKIMAQTPVPPTCSPFIVEVVPIQPNVNNCDHTNLAPDAFHGYYQVRLRSLNNSNLNNSIQLNYLSFNGQIGINHLTTHINKDLTDEINSLNPLYNLSITSINPETGDVSFAYGAPCPSNEVPLSLSPVGPIAILFTIAVDGMPGSSIKWKSFPKVTYENCNQNCQDNFDAVAYPVQNDFVQRSRRLKTVGCVVIPVAVIVVGVRRHLDVR